MRASVRFLLTLLFLGLLTSVFPAQARASASDQRLPRLIEAARQEGVVDFAGPASLTPAGAQALMDALNKKYGLSLKVNFSPLTSYTGLVAKIIAEAQAAQTPTYDVILVTDAHIVSLYSRNLLESFDWAGTFPHIPPQSIMLDNQAVMTDAIFAIPAYNTRLVRPQDVPKTWEDILDPKWKGKIVVSTGMQIWTRLTQRWGEEKTEEFMRRLADLKPIIGRYPEIHPRLESGEYAIAANQLSPFITGSEEKKAPVAYALEVKPIVVLLDVMTQVKNVRHPNAAKLFMAFSLTPEGQEIWWKYGKRTSPFVKGTPAWKFVQGKELLFGDKDFLLKREEELIERYGKILGLR